MLKKIIITLKKMILLLMIGLILSSCQRAIYVTLSAVSELGNTLDKRKSERMLKQALKKDGVWAYKTEKYKEGVKEAIKDIMERPINKEVKYEEVTLLIPENTKLKQDEDKRYKYIVDEKTGYGIPLQFYMPNYPPSYGKKIDNNRYIGIFFSTDASKLNSIDIILEKIAKANGFQKLVND